MSPSVYIETTIVSYLAARMSRDLIRAAQQQMTQRWWTVHRPQFNLVTSRFVLLEAESGDSSAAQARLNLLADIPLLFINDETPRLAKHLLTSAALPSKALRDAEHIAVCATNGVDFLLTWNCRHLANAMQRQAIIDACSDFGVRAPVICTPEELVAEIDDEDA